MLLLGVSRFVDASLRKREWLGYCSHMSTRTLAVVLALTAALVGCASRAPQPGRIPYEPVTCSGAAQCTALWSRAQVYLTQHGYFRLQLASDSVLQTFGPKPGFPMLAFTVTKEAAPDGSATITMDGGCDNTFGCKPELWEARQDFNLYLNAAKPAVMPATK